MAQQIIGYWYSDDKENQSYPMPVENSATRQQMRAQLGRFAELIAGAREIGYKGHSKCRLCGERNGSYEYVTKNYKIPEGLLHYIKDHRVLVPGLLESDMATKKPAKKVAKEKGEWKTKVLAEFEDGSTVWRAELSIAPDGSKFRSLRGYFKKADGTETPTRHGITLKAEGSKARFTELMTLMEHLT